MEASPCQSPLDSDLDAEGDWMGGVVSSASPFATPARQALGALRDRQRAAAHAGAPFAEEAVREMERRRARREVRGGEREGVVGVRQRRRDADLPDASGVAAVGDCAFSRETGAARPGARVRAREARRRGPGDGRGRARRCAGEGTPLRRLRRAGARDAESGCPDAEAPRAAAALFYRARGRASPGSPSAAMSDAGSNRARSPPREPLDESERLAEKDNERQLRSASEATDAARDRVRVAEERYRAARERLKEAFSAASRSRESSAMPTPRSGAEAAEAGVSTHVESGRNQNQTETETENGTGNTLNPKPSALAAEVREMAKKARAAAARSRLASARAATTAELAARDADAEASRVREAWTRRLARSPRATPGDDSLGKGVGSRDAVPADRWASSDEVRGKTDVLDRFMGSLTDMRASSPPDGEAAGGGDGRDVDVDGPFAGGGDEAGHRVSVSETPAPRAASGGARGGGGAAAARDEARETTASAAAPAPALGTPAAQTEAAATPATRLGVLSVSLLGDPREGETLTLGVDAVALPPDCGPVTLRWQRGATCAGPAGGSNPGTPRAGPPVPPAFKTILGARRASYTLTKADVGCVVRAVAAAGDANAGGNVFGSAETRGAVAAREW